MALMRARHEEFGVADVPDTDFYRENGWTEVSPDTPTAVDDRRAAENELRAGTFDPAAHPAPEVVAHLEAADDGEAARVLEAEKSGKARKTILTVDTEGA